MSATRDPATDQVAPQPNGKPSVWLQVIADMQKRQEHGVAKYGVALQPHNGRDPLLDIYEELLDAAVYIKTRMLEEKSTDIEGLLWLLDELMVRSADCTTAVDVRVACIRRDAAAREIAKWGTMVLAKAGKLAQSEPVETPTQVPTKHYPMTKGDGHNCVTMGGKVCHFCGTERGC